jgi:hypothetical protein
MPLSPQVSSLVCWKLNIEIAPKLPTGPSGSEPPFFPRPDAKAADPGKTMAQLHCWTFDLASGSDRFKREQLDDLSGDFPQFDERFVLNLYRRGHSAAPRKRDRVETFDMLVHHAFRSGKQESLVIPDVTRRRSDEATGDISAPQDRCRAAKTIPCSRGNVSLISKLISLLR